MGHTHVAVSVGCAIYRHSHKLPVSAPPATEECDFPFITHHAAAKSHQSCPTLCDPIDSGPTGSHSWDSPGKIIGVGCHCLLQCIKVKSESEVAQSYLTLCNPMDCSIPGSSVHGISQARVLEWVANAFSLLTIPFLILH